VLNYALSNLFRGCDPRERIPCPVVRREPGRDGRWRVSGSRGRAGAAGRSRAAPDAVSPASLDLRREAVFVRLDGSGFSDSGVQRLWTGQPTIGTKPIMLKTVIRFAQPESLKSATHKR
jgi:hypothetical protein